MSTYGNPVTREELASRIKGLTPRLLKVYDETKATIELKYKKIFQVYNTDQAVERLGADSGLGLLELTDEGADFKAATGVKIEDTNFNIKEYTKQVVVTRNAIKDSQYSQSESKMRALAISVKRTKDKAAFSVLTTGFSGTPLAAYPVDKMYNTGNNTAEKLFSVSHVLGNGGSASNVLSDSAPLSPTSVAKLKEMAMSTPTHDGAGVAESSGKFILVVPPALADLATRITESDRIQGSNYNDINSVKDVSVLVVPEIGASGGLGGTDTNYFLIDAEYNGLVFMNREDEFMETFVDQDNMNLKFNAGTRFGVGYTSFHGVFASKGDGTTVTN